MEIRGVLVTPHVSIYPPIISRAFWLNGFALAGTIVWVAEGWLFFVDYAVLSWET